MSKKFRMIYLALTPLWFILSWYISHRLHQHFMENVTTGNYHDRSFIYATGFALLYITSYLVIIDLYGKKENGL